MFKRGRLCGDGGANAGICMPEKIYPPGADGIEIALALIVFEPDAAAPADGHRRPDLVVLHLGAGMPQHAQVAFDEVLVRHALTLQILAMSDK